MLRLIKPRSPSLLGVDITSSAVKIVEISGGGGSKPCLENYGIELLPSQAAQGSLVKDTPAIVDTLKRLLAKSKFSTKVASVAVPDSCVISRIIQVNEGLSENEIEEVIIMEADKYIPFPMEEINFDFSIRGPSKNPALIDVLVVASKSENVNNRIEAVQRAGLNVQIVDVESFAVERIIRLLFEVDTHKKIIAVIDIGILFTHLFVFDGQKMIFSREEEFGSRQLDLAIAEFYNLTLDEANKKRLEKSLPADYQQQVLEPFLDLINIQVKRTLQFFLSTSPHDKLDYILLAGGVASFPGLGKRIEEYLKISTRLVNIFDYIGVHKKIARESVEALAPSLMISCGLALRNFN